MGITKKRDFKSGNSRNPKTKITDKHYTRSAGPPAREEAGPARDDNSTHVKYYVGSEIKLGIDYLIFTIYGGLMDALEIYQIALMDSLGEFDLEGSTRWYEERYTNGTGFALLAKPRIKTSKTHFRFLLPGQACDQLDMRQLKKIIEICNNKKIRLNCKRIDLKVDNVPFTPKQVYTAVFQGKLRTKCDLSTIKIYDQPFEQKETGEIGTQGLYIGSRKSERFVRIYDAHGFTRLELECKGDTANYYFYSLMASNGNFCDLAMGYIIDFMAIDEDYWIDFVKGYKRIMKPKDKPRDVTLESMLEVAIKQYAPTIGILRAIKGDNWLKSFCDRGLERAKNDPKYNLLVHRYGLDRDN
jgi:hypothetical protein